MITTLKYPFYYVHLKKSKFDQFDQKNDEILFKKLEIPDYLNFIERIEIKSLKYPACDVNLKMLKFDQFVQKVVQILFNVSEYKKTGHIKNKEIVSCCFRNLYPATARRACKYYVIDCLPFFCSPPPPLPLPLRNRAKFS